MEIIRDAAQACRELDGDRELALDLETSGLSPRQDKIAVVTLQGQESGKIAVLHVRGQFPKFLGEWLVRSGKRLTMHNGVSFDTHFLRAAGVDVESVPWYDTLVGECAVLVSGRRDLSVSLKNTAKRRLHVSIKKDVDHSSWMNPTLDARQVEYCVDDIRLLHDTREAQYARARHYDQEMVDGLELEMGILHVVHRMQWNGMPLDLDNLDRYRSEHRRRALEAENFLEGVFGKKVNFNSPTQVKEALHGVGIRVPDTQKETLTWVARGEGKNAEVCAKVLLCRQGRKREQMYSPAWVDEHVDPTTGCVHARLWQVGTETTRFSSSDPNMQQIPRDGREPWGNTPGHMVVKADYAQIEIRIAAYTYPDPELLRACESEDVHTMIASLMFNVAPEGVTTKQRRDAKAASFCLLFGGSWKTLYEHSVIMGSDITQAEAQDIYDRFMRRFTGVARAKERAISRAQRRGPVVIQFATGLRRVLVGSMLTPTRILNNSVQGNAASGAKYALRLAEERGLHKYFSTVVHDEIVAGRVPEREAVEFGVELERCMVDGMHEVADVPIHADVKIGRNWGSGVALPTLVREGLGALAW